MKQRKLSFLKKEADKWFSLYIRLKYADWKGYVKCYTCGHTSHYKKGMQCGHFASRRFMNTRFDEENCRVQCLTKESSLKMENGTYKGIEKIKVGDRIEAFDEKTFKKINAVVESAKNFIPDKIYKVEMEDGSVFFATGDHKVVVNNKWARVDRLLHTCNTYDILEL